MKRVLGVAVPVMLLFGCGVGEKDSIPKTEETSKQDKKIKVSEEKYPYYVMERMVDFNSQLDSYSQTVQRVFKGGGTMSNIMDAIDSLDYVLDDIENIEAPDRHKEDQKKMNEGVSEARKGLDLIVDAFKLYEKGDSDSIEKGKEKAQEGAEVLQHADKMWRPTLQSLHAIAPDSYEQALRNQSY